MTLGVVEPMLAKLVERIPPPGACPGGCLYEPKWDGFRAIAQVDEHGGVSLASRRSRVMTLAFPDVRSAVAAELPAGTTVDGEIVRWSAEGHLDFQALQRRSHAGRYAAELARAEPCHYILFDLLERDGQDLRHRPLAARRAALEDLLVDLPGTSALTLGLQTRDPDQAREWFDSFAAAGIEGLVIKAGDHPYRPGVRGWWKVKHYATTEAIVGGVTGTLARPRELLLGRYLSETGELMLVGRSAGLDDRAAAAVSAVLQPVDQGHPWPQQLPPSWTSSIYGRREPTEYVRVVPDVVVEVRVDVATDGHRWRHALRFLRLRPDVPPDEVPRDLDLEA